MRLRFVGGSGRTAVDVDGWSCSSWKPRFSRFLRHASASRRRRSASSSIKMVSALGTTSGGDCSSSELITIGDAAAIESSDDQESVSLSEISAS